jgi:hypothetical protein
MARYKIVGTKKIAGREPGETIGDEDLPGININDLITSGHIAPVTSRKKENPNGEDCASESGGDDQRS